MNSLPVFTQYLSPSILLTLLRGCAVPLTTREKGVLRGGALRAGTVAIVRNQIGQQVAGAAIGGAFGALSGGMVGDQPYGQDKRQSAQPYEIEWQCLELGRQRLELEHLRGQRRYDSTSHSTTDTVNVDAIERLMLQL